MTGRAGRKGTGCFKVADVLTVLPQLHSSYLLAVLPPVQPAVPPSSSHEGLPAKQAGWFGTRVLFWPAALPGPSCPLGEGSWPCSPGSCSGAPPHCPPALAFPSLSIRQPRALELTIDSPTSDRQPAAALGAL